MKAKLDKRTQKAGIIYRFVLQIGESSTREDPAVMFESREIEQYQLDWLREEMNRFHFSVICRTNGASH